MAHRKGTVGNTIDSCFSIDYPNGATGLSIWDADGTGLRGWFTVGGALFWIFEQSHLDRTSTRRYWTRRIISSTQDKASTSCVTWTYPVPVLDFRITVAVEFRLADKVEIERKKKTNNFPTKSVRRRKTAKVRAVRKLQTAPHSVKIRRTWAFDGNRSASQRLGKISEICNQESCYTLDCSLVTRLLSVFDFLKIQFWNFTVLVESEFRNICGRFYDTIWKLQSASKILLTPAVFVTVSTFIFYLRTRVKNQSTTFALYVREWPIKSFLIDTKNIAEPKKK